jgi:hypothetical protein
MAGSGGGCGPCGLIIGALTVPRLTIIVLWLFTDWFRAMFSAALWPVLGFIFMPTTLICYSAVENWYGGRWEFPQLLLLVVAVLMDGLPFGLGRRRE